MLHCKFFFVIVITVFGCFAFQIKVASAEDWLCLARMPQDFTQTEFESLLNEFGPIQQCFLIHSEISGDLFVPKRVF